LSAVLVGDRAFLFGSPWARNVPETFFIVDLNTMQVEIGPLEFNYLKWDSKAVYDGKFIYVIIGYNTVLKVPPKGIYQINPQTLQHSFIPVENLGK